MDYIYILLIAALIFVTWAQISVKTTFAKYSKIPTRSGQTGQDAARCILDTNGLQHIPVQPVGGELTDHYSPTEQVIRLSQPVYGVASAAAVGVAAHEAGHAVQNAVGYFPMKLRAMIIPITRFGSGAAIPLFFLGLFLSFGILIDIGLGLFFFSVLFQLITLPVEFNASSRAMAALRESGAYSEEELHAARKVLTAAAMTYVGALAVSMLQFLRLLSMARRR
ncbi:MAG: zinc metallopeptidase [Clostridia bacterium]|nr:zinc metallopeptidase [Clostridia bacterium]